MLRAAVDQNLSDGDQTTVAECFDGKHAVSGGAALYGYIDCACTLRMMTSGMTILSGILVATLT